MSAAAEHGTERAAEMAAFGAAEPFVHHAALFASAKSSCNPTRATAAIQHAVNDCAIIFELVVNRVRKTLRQHAVIAANDSVNSSIKH